MVSRQFTAVLLDAYACRNWYNVDGKWARKRYISNRRQFLKSGY